ncbi:glycosyltransferase [Actinokineospora globicatena]|uniref:glycosyltransferase n=1 Tax=Actinokineospora globicatena TaxID=103729 RepID=UPI0020A518C6|nr:glycosyltransferase [Actinokineospora globicatena]
MRVLLSTWGSRGDVEPMVGLAVALRSLGAQVRVCAPPDGEFVDRLAGVGVPVVPVGGSVRELTIGVRPSPEELPRRAGEVVAAQYEAVVALADGWDVVVATGPVPATAAARSAAEKLGIRYRCAAFQSITLPSPHHPPLAYRGRPLPPEVTDNRALWDQDAQTVTTLFGAALNNHRASACLPPVANVRDYALAGDPLLATDPLLDPWQEIPDLAVTQTGAWIPPDDRPLPPEVQAFLDAGDPPVYVGFGSMPLASDMARIAIDAIRAQGRRVLLGRGWADLRLTDTAPDCLAVGEVNQQALFPQVATVIHHGGAGTTTTATRAGVPQVVVPQQTDQPYWAGRVTTLGIGVAHNGPTPTVDSLSTALAQATSLHPRASEVATMITPTGATTAAELLLA